MDTARNNFTQPFWRSRLAVRCTGGIRSVLGVLDGHVAGNPCENECLDSPVARPLHDARPETEVSREPLPGNGMNVGMCTCSSRRGIASETDCTIDIARTVTRHRSCYCRFFKPCPCICVTGTPTPDPALISLRRVLLLGLHAVG